MSILGGFPQGGGIGWTSDRQDHEVIRKINLGDCWCQIFFASKSFNQYPTINFEMPPRLSLISSFRACTRVPQCLHRFVPLSARHGAQIQPSLPFHPASKPYSSSAPRPLTDRTSASTSSQTPSAHKPSSHKPAHAPSTRSAQPEYEMTFTCTPCKTRSSHRVSKHGYHHGSVLITCPECRNRHVISDHLSVCADSYWARYSVKWRWWRRCS